jgi:hypothetical protein
MKSQSQQTHPRFWSHFDVIEDRGEMKPVTHHPFLLWNLCYQGINKERAEITPGLGSIANNPGWDSSPRALVLNAKRLHVKTSASRAERNRTGWNRHRTDGIVHWVLKNE